MPLYSFINDETNEVRDVFFGMNDNKEYFGELEEEPKKWRRLFINPSVAMDTKINPFSSKDFVKKTANVKTYGEMWKLSAEMSERRTEKLGAPDPQKQKAEQNFYKQKKQ